MIVSAKNKLRWLVLFAAHGLAVYRGFSVAFDEVVFARFGPSLTTTPWPTRPTLKPSDYFRRLMHCSFIGDPFWHRQPALDRGGQHRVVSDYPYTASIWPHPRDIIERDFRDPSELERRKIVREKVDQLYGFDLD